MHRGRRDTHRYLQRLGGERFVDLLSAIIVSLKHARHVPHLGHSYAINPGSPAMGAIRRIQTSRPGMPSSRRAPF